MSTVQAKAWSGVSADGKVIATIIPLADYVRIEGSVFGDPFIFSADTWQAVARKSIDALIADRPHMPGAFEVAIVGAIMSMRADKAKDCPYADQRWHLEESCGTCDVGTRKSVLQFINAQEAK